MLIEIKHRHTGAVLYSTEVADADAQPIRTALVKAIASGAWLARANLAGAWLARAWLAGAWLAGAWLARADLADANLAGANLADANLARADLADANLAGAWLARADLARADLADANLADANLAGANLAGANLADAWNVPNGTKRTDPPTPYVRDVAPESAEDRATWAARRRERLTQRAADYRAAHPEVPVVERLDARILEQIQKPGCVLDMSDWHHGDACGTTHCRGGWAIHFAGRAGAELERDVGVEEASRRIYLASTGRVPHFFATNERALEDIKACAQEQTAEVRP